MSPVAHVTFQVSAHVIFSILPLANASWTNEPRIREAEDCKLTRQKVQMGKHEFCDLQSSTFSKYKM